MLEVFQRVLPPGVAVNPLAHQDYMAWARTQTFVQSMVEIGMYDDATMDDEFLHPAAIRHGEIVVDPEQICAMMHGVPMSQALGYCAYIALHELHHIEAQHKPGQDMSLRLHQEEECAEWLEQNFPIVNSLAMDAEQASPLMTRVSTRMSAGFEALGG